MSRLKAALSVVGTSTTPDRDRLKAALAARDAAQRVLDDARSTLDRLQSVVKISDAAARTAANATREATDARNAWVRNGCTPYSASHELQALDDAAAEASRVAQRAAADADSIHKTHALSRAQSVAQSAQVDLRGCEDRIVGAIGLILAAEAAPLLQRFEDLAEQYRILRAKVLGVRQVLAQPWTLDTKNKMNPSWEGEQLVEDALERAKIKTWAEERDAAQAHEFVNPGQRGGDAAMFERLIAPWRERAAQLRADPDA